MKNLIPTFVLCCGSIAAAFPQHAARMVPVRERVNVQGDSARAGQIVDGQWVAVGSKAPYAIQLDGTRPFGGRPSYRFELRSSDNTLKGYAKGETKGRAELSYCYAASPDFNGATEEDFQKMQATKTVYHHGKGICPQGSSYDYAFSVYIPDTLSPNVSAIFAQWHGMPSRTLVQTPEGAVKTLTADEFMELEKKVIFKKNIGHDKVTKSGKNGKATFRAGKANGWLVEQGGYPPLAFGFSQGWFYIKANSDRRWLSDKTDRCNASPGRDSTMVPRTSDYKASTIAYQEAFGRFPKNRWVTFKVHVDWSVYGKEAETIVQPGRLDVRMEYAQDGQKVSRHLVDNEEILIGRNDEEGYYFKFGIYRVGGSTVPVCYNLAGFSQKEAPRRPE